ncbi:MAG TPA: PEP-CTERM sorting domain-containing protein [Candidatus Binatia bacterium]|nr:PEP-CTERM sorting domain-containing protein [Candidatus Binatia bacterium]
MRLKPLLAVVAVALLCLAAPMVSAQNLLTNGGFEGGSFSGWTTGGNFEFSQVTSGAFDVYTGAEEGTFYATFGPVTTDGTISQSFNDTAGAQYVFSFYYAADGDDPSDFSAFWNGTPVLSLTDPNTGAQWTLESFMETGTGHDTISFSFRDDPAYIALDNVSVSPVSTGTTPEPSSFLLLGTGVLALGGVVRRKLSR